MIASRLDPEKFRAWRKKLGWKREETASKLGISLSTVRNYEKGCRTDRDDVIIPLLVAWACAAIDAGLKPLGEE
ncbi:MAG: helix-turn-helix transcriptional regulator [Patescibacteria group bacterium]|nr:helix-turn-helix transcriptional regulator [Patescibacteria group bacterium]